LAVVWRGAHWLERVCVTVEKKTGAGRIAVKTHSLEKDRQIDGGACAYPGSGGNSAICCLLVHNHIGDDNCRAVCYECLRESSVRQELSIYLVACDLETPASLLRVSSMLA
jgi:hypothetical protein